jgi:catechol 2,3-dioxygenase-like lactoylglutathione lyase family enzyme
MMLSQAGMVPSVLGKQMQVGLVVSDIETAMRYWTDTLKVGPFVYIENALAGRRLVHRGVVSDVQFSIAFSYVGETQIELIAQRNSAVSPYTEFLASGREGVHHFGFWPDDYGEACRTLERAGMTEVCAFYAADGEKNVSYFGGPHHLGAMVEIFPMTTMRKKYAHGIRTLVENWDGDRPVRRYQTRQDFMASDDCAALQPEK